MQNPSPSAATTSQTETAAPRNQVRPTAAFAGAFVVGGLIEILAPVALPAPPEVVTAMAWSGALLFAGGAWLTLRCLALFRHRETGIMPDQAARCVVSAGPYAWSRNPMFVGFIVMYVGASLFIPSIWPLFLLPAAISVTAATVVRREEEYMRGMFGQEYDAYAARVHRWFGRRG